MKQLFFLALIFTISSCSSEDVKEDSIEIHNRITEESSKKVVEKKNECALESQVISELGYSRDIDIEFPEDIIKPGELVDGATWLDKAGQHFIQVRQIVEGEFFMEGFNSELHVHHHVTCDNSKFEEVFHVKDFGGEIYKQVYYSESTLKVEDHDGDDFAETEFIYIIQPDGMDVSDIKLMMHSKGQKLPIRGKFTYEEGLQNIEKNFGEEFDEYPELKEYASSQWDAWFEKEKNKQ